MPTPLDKARQNPDGMKAKILAEARMLFGKYGYRATTTRMIAGRVGIDISTLHYHWGEKQDLYEAVILTLNEEIGRQLYAIEKIVAGFDLKKRIRTAIDALTDYMFAHPEVASLILRRYFSQAKQPLGQDIKVPEYISNIALAMGLALDRQSVSPAHKAGIFAVWNSAFSFVSGENFFRPVLGLDKKEYIEIVKKTLKFIMIPAFTQSGPSGADNRSAMKT